MKANVTKISKKSNKQDTGEKQILKDSQKIPSKKKIRPSPENNPSKKKIHPSLEKNLTKKKIHPTEKNRQNCDLKKTEKNKNVDKRHITVSSKYNLRRCESIKEPTQNPIQNIPTHDCICEKTVSIIESTPKCVENGYNSGDEYDKHYRSSDWKKDDMLFEMFIRQKGLVVKKMEEDGACLFRAVADQIYGDQNFHRNIRKMCMDFIALNSDYFSQYVTEDFNAYVSRKRLDTTFGNHIEMLAISQLYDRNIVVFSYGKNPISINRHKPGIEPIRLSYHRGSHYNSLVSVEQDTSLILTDMTTDWDALNEELEKQVIRESYLQFVRDKETIEVSNRNKNDWLTSPEIVVNESDYGDIVAQVIAQSQQEYESLRKN